mgnify:CR=1 FL=1
MQYNSGYWNIIHWDGINELRTSPFNLTVELAWTIHGERKGRLGMTIEWRIRMYDRGIHKFSAIFTCRYMLKFNGLDNNIKDTIDFLNGSYKEMSDVFLDKISSHIIGNMVLPEQDELFIFERASQILTVARQFGLLK